jgi:hypothetical protein
MLDSARLVFIDKTGSINHKGSDNPVVA